jgi:exopolysaccharide production protein ExoQ
MNTYNSDWRLTQAPGLKTAAVPIAFRPGKLGNRGFTPISQEVLTWLLFWPILTLIARQTVFFSGPARSTAVYQNGSAMAGPAGSHNYVYVQLFFLLGFVLAGHQLIWATVKKNWLIPAMLGLAFCSVLWSASPIISLQICIEVGLCTLFGCYLSAKYDTDRLMQFVIFMGTVAALLSIFFAVALPSYGRFQGYAPDAWQGICNHKNSLGISMAYVLSPIFFTNSYSRGRRILYGALILFVIYESKSVGAWADTAGMILFVSSIWIVRRLRARELTLFVILAVVLGAVSLGLVAHFWVELTAFFGKDPSMTGRAPIYVEVWRSILKRPLLGYGFGGFWYPGNFECQRIRLALRWPGIGYSESGLMELVLQIGFVGLGLVVAMIGKAVVQGIRLMRSPSYSPRVGWFLTILLLAALTNIEAGWLLTMDTLDWVLILVACIGLNAETNRVRTAAGVSAGQALQG